MVLLLNSTPSLTRYSLLGSKLSLTLGKRCSKTGFMAAMVCSASAACQTRRRVTGSFDGCGSAPGKGAQAPTAPAPAVAASAPSSARLVGPVRVRRAGMTVPPLDPLDPLDPRSSAP